MYKSVVRQIVILVAYFLLSSYAFADVGLSNIGFSTRVIGIAVLNAKDAGYEADKAAFKTLFADILPRMLLDAAGTPHAIDVIYKVIDIPEANGDWHNDVKKVVDTLVTDKRDIRRRTTLFFHFGGHGGTLLGTDSGAAERQLLSLDRNGRSEFLFRDDLFTTLRKCNCRTTVFVTDTCTNGVAGPLPVAHLAGGAPVAVDLLIRYAGVVDIYSSSYRSTSKPQVLLNEFAWSDTSGGLFSRLLYSNLGGDWPTDTPPKEKAWEAFGKRCSAELQTDFGDFKQRNPSIVQKSQTAQFIIDNRVNQAVSDK